MLDDLTILRQALEDEHVTCEKLKRENFELHKYIASLEQATRRDKEKLARWGPAIQRNLDFAKEEIARLTEEIVTLRKHFNTCDNNV